MATQENGGNLIGTRALGLAGERRVAGGLDLDLLEGRALVDVHIIAGVDTGDAGEGHTLGGGTGGDGGAGGRGCGELGVETRLADLLGHRLHRGARPLIGFGAHGVGLEAALDL